MVRFIFNDVFFWFSQPFSTTQTSDREVETTETDELIQDIKLTNQKMMNLIRMKTAVLKLMKAIQILPLISKRK